MCVSYTSLFLSIDGMCPFSHSVCVYARVGNGRMGSRWHREGVRLLDSISKSTRWAFWRPPMYILSSDAIRVHTLIYTHFITHTQVRIQLKIHWSRDDEAMHTHNREIYLDQGNKLLTHTFCVHNAYTYYSYVEWIEVPTTMATTHILYTEDLLYYENDISNARATDSLTLTHSFNFFVSLHWPILLLLISFLSCTQCARFASLHRTMARHKHIHYVCIHIDSFLLLLLWLLLMLLLISLCVHFILAT